MPLGSPTALVKLCLLAHAIAATVLTGALTHLAVVIYRARGGKTNPRLLKLYPRVAFIAWAVTFALGTMLYPTYRIDVRAHHLDAEAPWAVILFDIKENFAVLLAPFVFGTWWLTRKPRPTVGSMLALCGYAAAAGVWFNLLAGWLVVSMRSV